MRISKFESRVVRFDGMRIEVQAGVSLRGRRKKNRLDASSQKRETVIRQSLIAFLALDSRKDHDITHRAQGSAMQNTSLIANDLVISWTKNTRCNEKLPA